MFYKQTKLTLSVNNWIHSFIHSLVIFVSITKVDNYEPPTRSLFRSSLHHYIFSQTCPIHNILHPHSSRCTNLSSTSFCSTTSQKHSLSCASPYSKSNFHIHNLILRIQNSSVSSSLS